jgi:hypothetical protein
MEAPYGPVACLEPMTGRGGHCRMQRGVVSTAKRLLCFMIMEVVESWSEVDPSGL